MMRSSIRGIAASGESRRGRHRLTEWPRYLEIIKAFWVEGLAQGAGVAHPVISLAAMGACLKIAPRAAPESGDDLVASRVAGNVRRVFLCICGHTTRLRLERAGDHADRRGPP